MDDKMMKKISALLSRFPKKDIEANLEKAKKVLQTAKKEDLRKLLNNKKFASVLGKDKEELSKTLDNIDLSKINIENIEKELKKEGE